MIILNSTDDYQIVKSLVAIVDVRSVHCSHSVPERILAHLFSLLEQLSHSISENCKRTISFCNDNICRSHTHFKVSKHRAI